MCDGVNGGCSQLHNRVSLALWKDKHALLQVCVCVCVCVCVPTLDLEVSRYHNGTTMCVLLFSLAIAYCNIKSLTLNLIKESNHLLSMMIGLLPKSPSPSF